MTSGPAASGDPSRVAIRRAEASDAAAVLDFLQAFRAEGLRTVRQHATLPSRSDEEAFIGRLDGRDGIMLLALAGERVVGCLACETRGDTFEFGISVLREHRGAGLGTRLVNELLAWARGRGLRPVELDVFSSNAAAIRLYRRLGFVEIERSSQRIGPGDEQAESVRMRFAP